MVEMKKAVTIVCQCENDVCKVEIKKAVTIVCQCENDVCMVEMKNNVQQEEKSRIFLE